MVVRTLLYSALLCLASCTWVAPQEEANLINDLPRLSSITDSLSLHGCRSAKWAEEEGKITYASTERPEWSREFELLISTHINVQRYRDAFHITDTLVGQVRTVIFEAVHKAQEVHRLELRMRGAHIFYASLEKGRSNFFSESRQAFVMDGNMFWMHMKQRVAGIFQSERTVSGQILPDADLWLARFQVMDHSVPVSFVLNTEEPATLVWMNGTERVSYDFAEKRGDSLWFESAIYSSFVILTAENDSTVNGRWINAKSNAPYHIPFAAKKNVQWRFHTHEVPSVNLSGSHQFVYEATENMPADTLQLVMEQRHHFVSASILSESGDYRYLEGVVRNDSLLLSAMDGTHLISFEGRIDQSKIKGIYRAAPARQKLWTAYLHAEPKLKNPLSITGFAADSIVRFGFPDSEGLMHHLDDPEFAGKPVVVSIMGTWCSNCSDEAEFLNEALSVFEDRGLKAISLNFELVSDSNKAMANMKRFSTAFALRYPMLLAGLSSDKETVQRALPLLTNFYAYPTLLVLDASHRVVRTHTGYSGPATGQPYEDFRKEYFKLFESLLRPQAP